MAIVIWKEPISTKYVASFLSWPFALRFVVFCCNIIFAFLIAYGTQDLWVRESFHFEQAQVDFEGSSIFYLHELHGSTFFASSGVVASHLYPATTVVPNISVGRIDSNDDGKIDRLTITSSFPLPSSPTGASYRAADMVHFPAISPFAFLTCSARRSSASPTPSPPAPASLSSPLSPSKHHILCMLVL
jgi:hypothetical protein